MLKVQPRSTKSTDYVHPDSDYPVSVVRFKVSLCEMRERKGTGELGVGVFLPRLTAKGDIRNEEQAITSVEFDVAVVLPYVNKAGEYLNPDYSNCNFI